MSDRLSHIDDSGQARMVDVGRKPESERVAVARGAVVMRPDTLKLIIEGNVKKGDVLSVAQLAGVMAAKRTSGLIPLCHPLSLNHVEVNCRPNPAESRVDIEATVRVNGKTGVEMEALTAVSVAALTVYDMAKAVDRGMRLTDIRLMAKSGGQSGDYVATE
jgi:cyclic pyranopterin phosphate synthase